MSEITSREKAAYDAMKYGYGFIVVRDDGDEYISPHEVFLRQPWWRRLWHWITR